MKYVVLGYFDEAKMAGMSPEAARTKHEASLAYNAELQRGGHALGGEALQSSRNAVTMRLNDGKVVVTDGPYAETKEMLGGFLLIDARDLNHAIALMSKHPGMKQGIFEIRPVDEEMNCSGR
jgi:hypothetical protein